MRAVLLISHGSRSPKTKEEVSALVERLKEQNQDDIFEYAFLELEAPSIPEGIDICIQQGATEIVVLLNFLNSGRHVDEDIPTIIKGSQAKYPNVQFRISQPVGQHGKITDLFLDML